MTDTIRAESISQARAVIEKRIRGIDTVNAMFRRSYSGYTDNTGEQAATAVLLGLLVTGLGFLSPRIIREVCALTDLAVSSLQGKMGLVALYAICLFLALQFLKIMIRLSRISKINGHIRKTTAIKKSLSQISENVDASMREISQKMESGNEVFAPENEYDGQILKYLDIAKTYRNDGNLALDHMIKIAFLVAGIAFGAAFIAVTAAPTAATVCRVFGVEGYSWVFVAYVVISIIVFILVNLDVFSKNKDGKASGFFSTIACAPIGMAAVWILCGIIALIYYSIVICIVIGLLGLVCGVFSKS